MGTSWLVKCVLPSEAVDGLVRARIESTLDGVIEQMSTWEPRSALSQYNGAAAGNWVAMPDQCLYVLRYALAIAAASDGAYDPTAGALVNLWGFGPESGVAVPPTPAAIAAARQRLGWQRVEVEAARGRVYQPGGIYLDFSAIAKGYAVDLISRALSATGIAHHLVEVGGELRGSGVKPDGQPWWVQLENPPDAAQGDAAGLIDSVVVLHGLSVATSGDYRKYVDIAEYAPSPGADAPRVQRYSHTIDPRTAQPIRHRVAAVSVVHPDCIAADALSTALIVMGSERGMRFATQHGIAARFVQRGEIGHEEILSPALEALAR